MKRADNKFYLDIEQFEEGIETLRIFTVSVLFAFVKHSDDLKDLIIRNFIARGITILKGILALYKQGDFQNGWSLYRTLLDRLFHIESLSQTDEFQLFHDWCFVKQYEQRNKARSDPLLKSSLDRDFFKESPEEKARYQKLKKKGLDWKRPYPEDSARRLGLPFLYAHGYDYASMHVHPMSDDGFQDFLDLIGIDSNIEPVDQSALLNNACLVLTLLIQEGMNASNLKWVRVAYDFIDNFRELLNSGSTDYRVSFLKVSKLFELDHLCSRP
ncbi:MAG: hypothetical protein GH143_07725 [Calditrichaeota bacterium]|nr:hypothetical protein [Calditrichota bacterium]